MKRSKILTRVDRMKNWNISHNVSINARPHHNSFTSFTFFLFSHQRIEYFSLFPFLKSEEIEFDKEVYRMISSSFVHWKEKREKLFTFARFLWSIKRNAHLMVGRERNAYAIFSVDTLCAVCVGESAKIHFIFGLRKQIFGIEQHEEEETPTMTIINKFQHDFLLFFLFCWFER